MHDEDGPWMHQPGYHLTLIQHNCDRAYNSKPANDRQELRAHSSPYVDVTRRSLLSHSQPKQQYGHNNTLYGKLDLGKRLPV